MTQGDSLVVMTCSSCGRRVQTTAVRAKVGLCSTCERSGSLNLPEPEAQPSQVKLFESERRTGGLLSAICVLIGALSGVAMLMAVLSAIAPGGGPPILWAAVGGSGLMLALIGWLLASLLRVAIAVANSVQRAA